jgi:hypothetical protein
MSKLKLRSIQSLSQGKNIINGKIQDLNPVF